ncbi:hypothetical protein niasHS_002186 [Heterodera schachtii]|uniref:Protein kinase domain-containing protein n=1 Tax=Heterodera schachtii TaxID=97005 RepID=A0ABD2KMJ5_HETSC
MTDALVELSPGALVSGRWTVIKKLGAGAFGAVYLCQDQDGITKGALKTEPINAPFPLLALEATVLRSFDTLRASSGKHFCRCMDLGRDQQPDPASGRTLEFNFIVMSLVGRAFDKLLPEAGDCFSPGTAIGAALQLLKALQALHKVGYLHRDIKPANLAIGLPETNEQRLLYLLDFGMARKYLKDDGTIRRQRATANFRGTPIYAPISAHIKRDYSRGDDIESWFYVLIKFYKGAVPWKFIKDINEIGQYKCRRLKDEPAKVRKEAIEELTGGCPPEFNKILAHIDGLEPEDWPDYEMIEKTLRGCLKKLDVREHPYDWEIGRQNVPPQQRQACSDQDKKKKGGSSDKKSGSSDKKSASSHKKKKSNSAEEKKKKSQAPQKKRKSNSEEDKKKKSQAPQKKRKSNSEERKKSSKKK